MLKYFAFFVFLFSFEVFTAQDLTAVMKMPEVIAPGEDYIVEVTITKGAINSYIKFTQKLPPHFKATKIESNGGNFTFDDSIIRIVWLFPPASSDFSFSYKVKVPKDIKGTQKIGGKIYYFFNTNREVFSFDKKNVTFGTANGNIVSTSAIKEIDSVLANNSIKKDVESTLTNTIVAVAKDTIIKVVVIHDTIISSSVAANTKSAALDSLSKSNAINAIAVKDTLVTSSKTSGTALIVKDTVVTITKAVTITSSVKDSLPSTKLVTIIVKDTLVSPSNTTNTQPITKDTVVTITKSVTITSSVKDTLPSTIPVTINKVTPSDSTTITPASSNITPSTENSAVAGASDLSYCVQLGVFKEEVPLETANRFLKISAKGIKNFKDNKGFTTFTIGNFNTHDEAINLKNEMLEKGFQGAFIVACPRDKSTSNNIASVTSINKETKTISTNTGTNSTTTKSETKTHTNLSKSDDVVNSKNPVNSNSVSSSANKSYRVQIGAFKEEVPLATANRFLKLAAKGVKNLKDDRGFTVYTVGDFLNREDALKLKTELIEKGFQGAFIVTYENGQPVK